MNRVAPVLAFCAALVPVSAEALSCAQWTPAQAFEMAEASDSRYSVVIGRFALDGALPNSDAVVSAALSGRALTRTGFDAPWSESVRLEVSCILSWCGAVNADLPYLVFVEQTDSGLSVALPACSYAVFPNPTEAVERELTRCLVSGRCDTN